MGNSDKNMTVLSNVPYPIIGAHKQNNIVTYLLEKIITFLSKQTYYNNTLCNINVTLVSIHNVKTKIFCDPNNIWGKVKYSEIWLILFF